MEPRPNRRKNEQRKPEGRKTRRSAKKVSAAIRLIRARFGTSLIGLSYGGIRYVPPSAGQGGYFFLGNRR
jgi:hypothetical protein